MQNEKETKEEISRETREVEEKKRAVVGELKYGNSISDIGLKESSGTDTETQR